MATISSKEIALEMLRNNGTYPGDPQVAAISSYRGANNETLFHLALRSEDEIVEALDSPYVINPTVLWTRQGGLTLAGTLMLHDPMGPAPETTPASTA